MSFCKACELSFPVPLPFSYTSPPLSFSSAAWCLKAFTFVTLALGGVYAPFNSGEAEILCLTCFEKKIASALFKWFPMSSNTQQPGLTGSDLPKQATKERWYIPLVFLTLAVSCRGRCYSIESDCVHIAQHKWGPFIVYKEPSTASPLAASWEYTGGIGCRHKI